MRVTHPPTDSNNWLKKVSRMVRDAEISKGEAIRVDIHHDDWCNYFVGGNCNCDPDIILTRKRTE